MRMWKWRKLIMVVCLVFGLGTADGGDNGYVRGGRQEARPVHRSNFQDLGASSSREPKTKDAEKGSTGRRVKRTQKREAAAKVVEAKHSSFPSQKPYIFFVIDFFSLYIMCSIMNHVIDIGEGVLE